MALEAFWRTLTRFDASKIATEIAVRNTLGFLTAFLLGNAFGGPGTGVLAALGALNVSYSDSRDPYALRARRMILASALTGVAVTVGALSGLNNLTAVIAATLWAFGAGMLVAVSTTAADLGVITLVTLVIFAATPLTPLDAVQAGLIAFTGALLQTLLAIALWPVMRFDPERRIVGGLYLSLGSMARKPPLPSEAPPFSIQISDAQDHLAGLHGEHSAEAERLVFLVNQAERIRLSLLTLGRLARRLGRDPDGAAASDALTSLMQQAAASLEKIGTCTVAGKTPARVPAFESAAALRPPPNPKPFFSALLSDANRQIDALGGQIRSAAGASAPTWTATSFHPALTTFQGRFGERLAKLRANLSFDSTVFRHALRLAVCLGLSDAIGRAISLERTYWIPMTVAIVLKPDFTATVSRGVLRIAGTFAGLLLATGLFHFFHTGVATDIALMTVFTFLLRWVGAANYGIFVTALSSMIVLFIATTGAPPADVIAARAINTSIGGVMAMIAYFVWPTWETANVGAALSNMLDRYRDYFHAVVEAYRSESVDEAISAIDAVRIAGRRARSNAEASVDRLSSEPGVAPERMKALNTLLVNSHTFVHAVMSLEAGLYQTTVAPARKETLDFAAVVELVLDACAKSLGNHTPLPKNLPDLRAMHNRIRGSHAEAARYTLVNVETDRIVTSLNTVREALPIAAGLPA